MAKLGFKRLLSDSGIFVYKDKNGAPKVIVIVYVDDAIFEEPEVYSGLTDRLNRRCSTLTQLG